MIALIQPLFYSLSDLFITASGIKCSYWSLGGGMIRCFKDKSTANPIRNRLSADELDPEICSVWINILTDTKK
jgi:hypothetical protein